MRSDRLGETLLPRRIALPVFAGDALSSVAYAPDEIFLTLAVSGGAFATTHSWQIGPVVVFLFVFVMLIVVASNRQNVHDVVMVYIPEYVVGRWYERLLHDQSALRLKGRLFFTPGVMVASVPWQLRSSEGVEERFDGSTAGSVRHRE